MIQATFGISRIPFSKDISPTDLFMHQQFIEMDKRLRMLFANRGIGLFSGDVGCGKSTALRLACQNLSTQTHKIVYLCRGLDNPGAFYTFIAPQLDIVPKFRKTDVATQVYTAIAEQATLHKIATVIVIDEAHLLKPEILDEVRLLHNADFDSTDLLATALVGQPSLRKTIELNRFLPLRQRITVQYHLGSLTRDDAHAYFHHHIALAKAPAPIFADDAIEPIIAAARGVPRVINSIALKAMARAADAKRSCVDHETVMDVLDELGLK
jgi:type II secretory pathway predicted ATPase ExeA